LAYARSLKLKSESADLIGLSTLVFRGSIARNPIRIKTPIMENNVSLLNKYFL
jgi:hypothetical protein